MSEEQYVQEQSAPAKSVFARVLLGKVLSHKVFSDRALYLLLLGVSFLLPVFFIPGQFVAPEFAKMVLLEVAVLIGTFMWAAGRLRDGHLNLPKSVLLLVSALLVVQFVVAAIVSPAPMLSFIGSGYDIGTVNSFLALFLFLFLGSMAFSTRDRVLSLYASLMFSTVIIMVYQLLRYFFGADFLAFGLFTNEASTPVGKWNDMVTLMGGAMLLVLTTLYFFPQNKVLRLPAYAVFLVGLFFLLLVNFKVLWFILFVLAGMLVIFAIYEGERAHRAGVRSAAESGSEHHHKPIHKRVAGHLPVLTTVLLVVAFIYGSGLTMVPLKKDGPTIGSFIEKVLKPAPYSEVVLTPQFTFNVVAQTLKDSPLFGTSPNRFGTGYLMYKTSDINRTPFWDTSDIGNYAFGRIPTYFATTGIIGTILWVIFVVFLFIKSRKIFALLSKDRIAAYMAFSLFMLVIYFWSIAFFYLPNIAMFALAFLFTGALIAFLVSEGVVPVYRVSFDRGSKLSMILTPVVVIVLAGVVASSVLLYRQVSSLVAFRDAQVALAANNLDQAKVDLVLASTRSERDIYYRSLSNIALVQLQQLANAKLPAEQVQPKANELISEAGTYAQRALTLDPSNFENHLQVGGVYDILHALGIETVGTETTFNLAKLNYQQGLSLNPRSPRILFMLARLEFSAGNRAEGKKYLYQALAERPNYLEALSFAVQMEISDKNPGAAVDILRAGINVEPTNFLLRFALGYLYFEARDYKSAIGEFEAAVVLNPVYADAKYFLGLSYSKTGRTAEAVQQFTDVQTLNPDNKDIANILKNLKAGSGALENGATSASPVNDALNQLNQGSN
ncbi:MAG: hypothetical protein A2494_01755 [Candidatus Lloydbacteria bacterium RIFOXYC12_FULL_46_25]|uniref:Uncharacterized protein n=1 Tax=Candidatus Lloydbacteria bacterium RIFOXYC12_FULL_46_25 TaxID=1798670 RepID=A0A1G2E0X8_9BACT|nr:MAG: hypothetical protein A2494_01755 [Candidatus Lloydbacteria bacterium RIFOXYC12_FULL_46_25]